VIQETRLTGGAQENLAKKQTKVLRKELMKVYCMKPHESLDETNKSKIWSCGGPRYLSFCGSYRNRASLYATLGRSSDGTHESLNRS
jgi:hypothetical protein